MHITVRIHCLGQESVCDLDREIEAILVSIGLRLVRRAEGVRVDGRVRVRIIDTLDSLLRTHMRMHAKDLATQQRKGQQPDQRVAGLAQANGP